jgi:uncharacterized pyridoxamine 5'-phosphate oxidase family protein
MSYKNLLKDGQELVLATSSSNARPHAVMVVLRGFEDGKLLIGAAVLKKTLENIRANKHVSLVASGNGEYYRIDGRAAIETSGKYLELVKQRSIPPLPHSVIIVEITEIYDLDKRERVF